jgi:hypothetical protein
MSEIVGPDLVALGLKRWLASTGTERAGAASELSRLSIRSKKLRTAWDPASGRSERSSWGHR